VWPNPAGHFEAWCAARTGYPIVDAAMRQLNQTGYMHNRLRMIVASFLVKDLHVDWRWGERYFAEKLIDYDQAANVGGWQWSAGVGTDAQPWFRIFNPVTQSENFDPKASSSAAICPNWRGAGQVHSCALEAFTPAWAITRRPSSTMPRRAPSRWIYSAAPEKAS
jgi:deoxyribodipyrimidine photolyase